jgi:tetratricopeptide (TPR) repeat protein
LGRISQIITFLTSLGRAQEAIHYVRQANELIEALPAKTATDFINIARVRAGHAGLLGKGRSEEIKLAQDEKQKQADLAMAALQQAVDKGFKQLATLQQLNDFDSLRDRSDFSVLVSRLEKASGAEELAQHVQSLNSLDARLNAARQVQEIRREVLDASPESPAHKADMAASLHSVGVIQRDLGEFDESRKSLTQALAMREALLQRDPKNLALMPDLASSHIALGRLAWKTGINPARKLIRDHQGLAVSE